MNSSENRARSHDGGGHLFRYSREKRQEQGVSGHLMPYLSNLASRS